MDKFIEVRTIDNNQCILNTSFIKSIHKDIQFSWSQEEENKEVYIIHITGTLNRDNDDIVIITKNEYNRLANLLIRKN